MKFADLGLVVIDEEQHFGAADKAKLSSLAKGVHTLWMSATPIPRTLAAGLAGFRDLSVIATPPVHRLPVVTKIAPLSDAAIVAALLREQRRRGQEFPDLPAHSGSGADVGARSVGGSGSPHHLSPRQAARRRDGRPDDELSSTARRTRCWRPISSRVASIFPVQIPSSSAGPRSSVWPNFISSGAG